jgi:hypothetical protein
MKRISSILTFPYKYIFSFSWIIIGGFCTAIAIINDTKDWFSYAWAAAWLIASVGIYKTCFRILNIRIDENYLYLSNFWKQATVDMTEVHKIREFCNFTPKFILIELKNTCEFGDKILFMPRTIFSLGGKHPIINELNILKGKHSKPSS